MLKGHPNIIEVIDFIPNGSLKENYTHNSQEICPLEVQDRNILVLEYCEEKTLFDLCYEDETFK